MLLVLSMFAAHAEIAPECVGMTKPANYDEQVQQDYLANYVALATTFSPIHAPVPHDGGRGSIGLEVGIIPPLGCEQRYVLEWTKTEDTNKSPVLPRPRVSFTFQPIAKILYPYAGLALIPGIPVNGTRNFLVSAEVGLGLKLGEQAQLGLRGHGTMQRTLGDIATAFEETEPTYLDLYVASTVGADLMFGYELGKDKLRVTPYIAAGVTDVTTFFWIGDDSVVTNNLHPYLGPTLSLGADLLIVDRLRVGAEFYAAPGGHSLPDPDTAKGGFVRYGNLYTGRLALGVEL
jgi:hypothetical protein